MLRMEVELVVAEEGEEITEYCINSKMLIVHIFKSFIIYIHGVY